jgi:hypothetical protein
MQSAYHAQPASGPKVSRPHQRSNTKSRSSRSKDANEKTLTTNNSVAEVMVGHTFW